MTGNRAASEYQQTILSTSTQIDRYREAQFLVAPFRNLPEPDKALLGYLDDTQNALSARATLMAHLAEVYSSLDALASYDAQGDITGSLNGLAGAGNSFANAVGVSDQPIPPIAASSISSTGGLIASEIQKRKVKAASAALRERLILLVPFLQREGATLANLEKGLGASAGSTAVELWNHGIGSPDPIFAANIGTFGLSYVAGSYKNTCQNLPEAEQPDCRRQVRDAVVAVVKLRARRDIELQVRLLQLNIQAIQALISAHQQREAGEPVNLATLAEKIAQAQTVVASINQSQDTGKTTKSMK